MAKEKYLIASLVIFAGFGLIVLFIILKDQISQAVKEIPGFKIEFRLEPR